MGFRGGVGCRFFHEEHILSPFEPVFQCNHQPADQKNAQPVLIPILEGKADIGRGRVTAGKGAG
jgi:hypothetical protein